MFTIWNAIKNEPFSCCDEQNRPKTHLYVWLFQCPVHTGHIHKGEVVYEYRIFDRFETNVDTISADQTFYFRMNE